MIEQVTDLPALPQAGLKLMRLMEDPDGNAHDVVKVVETDPTLSAKLLRICNSAAFGVRQRVNSVEQAVFVRGFAEVQRLAVALSFGRVMSKPLDGCGHGETFWMHSLLVAFGAESLARSAAQFKNDSSAAYTAGLLHDIGKLVLDSALNDELRGAIHDMIESDGCSRVHAEKCVLGLDHADVGASLLEKWQLPACLVEAVRNHHRPVCKPEPMLSAFVHIANCMAHQSDAAPGGGGSTSEADEDAIASVGIDAEGCKRALLAVREQAETASDFAVTA